MTTKFVPAEPDYADGIFRTDIFGDRVEVPVEVVTSLYCDHEACDNAVSAIAHSEVSEDLVASEAQWLVIQGKHYCDEHRSLHEPSHHAWSRLWKWFMTPLKKQEREKPLELVEPGSLLAWMRSVEGEPVDPPSRIRYRNGWRIFCARVRFAYESGASLDTLLMWLDLLSPQEILDVRQELEAGMRLAPQAPYTAWAMDWLEKSEKSAAATEAHPE